MYYCYLVVKAIMPSDKDSVKCECPLGFKGDGFKKCEDINECKERKACQCPECSCKNTWGSYECSCSGFTSEISVGGRLAYNVIIGTCSRWGVPRLQIWIKAIHGLRDQSNNGTIHATGQPTQGSKPRE